jgi:pSer/pThr/pTyr-binding forkhead associated (FHA) protein
MKHLLLAVHNGTKSVHLDMPLVEGYVIGRSDDALNYVPDIDLAAYDSRERGVSRRHAALVNYEGAVHIIDLASANGTYLNGKRLSPDQPYLLGNFNELRLGTLDVIITIS